MHSGNVGRELKVGYLIARGLCEREEKEEVKRLYTEKKLDVLVMSATKLRGKEEMDFREIRKLKPRMGWKERTMEGGLYY